MKDIHDQAKQDHPALILKNKMLQAFLGSNQISKEMPFNTSNI